MSRELSWEQRGLVFLYGAAIAGYPLVSVLNVVLGIPNRLTSVPFRAIVLGLSIAVVARAAMRSAQFYRGLLWAPLALFLLLYLYRLYSDAVFAPIALTMPPVEFLSFGLGVAFIPMLPFFEPLDPRARAPAIRVIQGMASVTAVLLLVIGVQQFLAGDLIALWHGRFGTETLNPISVGHLGASIAILASYRLVWEPPEGALRRALLLGSLALGAATVAVSASRGPMLAGLVAIAALWFMPLRGRARLAMATVTGVLAIIVVAAAVRAEDRLGIPIVSRVTSIAEAREDGTSSLRLTYITDAWDQFLEHPVLGSALEERNSMFYPHNINVEAFMATGIFGGVAFLVLSIAGLWASFHLLRRDPDYGWIGMLFVQALIGASTSGSIVGSPTYYAFLAAAVSTAARGVVPKSA